KRVMRGSAGSRGATAYGSAPTSSVRNFHMRKARPPCPTRSCTKSGATPSRRSRQATHAISGPAAHSPRRADNVEDALGRLVERVDAFAPEAHERQVVDELDLRAGRQHLEEVRHAAELDPQVLALEDEREHARVRERGQRDEDLAHAMADHERAQTVDVPEDGMPGDVLDGHRALVDGHARDAV